MKRKPLLPHVQAWVDPKGRCWHYFRKRGSPRVKLPGAPFSPEFMAAYQQAMASAPVEIGIKRSAPGSVSAAIAAYYTNAAFKHLAAGTQGMRRAILERLRNDHGVGPIARMPPQFISKLLDKLEPHAARNWFKALRGFCRFCVANQLMKVDPTASLQRPKVKPSEGHHSWTDAEVAQYEATHPIGSKARLAFALGLYTTQRGGDVVRLGRQHIREGWLYLTQQKTGTAIEIPVRPELQAVLDATPTPHLTFLVTRRGGPYTRKDLSEQFRGWCTEAGLPSRCVFHGLRKAGLTRLADAGCDPFEVAAWSGHKSLSEVERYTKAANRKRAAQSALAKSMKNDAATPSVSNRFSPMSNALKSQEKK